MGFISSFIHSFFAPSLYVCMKYVYKKAKPSVHIVFTICMCDESIQKKNQMETNRLYEQKVVHWLRSLKSKVYTALPSYASFPQRILYTH